MSKVFKVKKTFLWMFFVLSVVFFILSLVVGNRDLNVGADSFNYAGFFYGFISNGSVGRFEPGIQFLAIFASFFSSKHQFFFSLIYLIISFLLAGSFYNLYILDRTRSEQFLSLLVFIGILFFSSWYFTSVANGLRQGVSLGFLYFSISFYMRDKKAASVFLYVLSVFFHISSFMLMPFIILFIWLNREKVIFIIFSILALCYPSGVNELIVKFFSDLVGLSIYNDIKFYAQIDSLDGAVLWSGFQLNLFLYTVFWYLFPFVLNLYLSCFKERELVFKFLSIYAVLSMPYFVFGFGGFSNRFAFIAWLFLPILQSVIFMQLKFKYKFKFIFSWLIAGVGIIYFLLLFVDLGF